jgi:hypothetical protein
MDLRCLKKLLLCKWFGGDPHNFVSFLFVLLPGLAIPYLLGLLGSCKLGYTGQRNNKMIVHFWAGLIELTEPISFTNKCINTFCSNFVWSKCICLCCLFQGVIILAASQILCSNPVNFVLNQSLPCFDWWSWDSRYGVKSMFIAATTKRSSLRNHWWNNGLGGTVALSWQSMAG